MRQKMEKAAEKKKEVHTGKKREEEQHKNGETQIEGVKDKEIWKTA